MKVYEVNRGGITIKEHEAERETERCYFIKGRKYSKVSDFYQFFPTREEARQHILGALTADVENRRRGLEYAEAKLIAFAAS